MDERHTTTSSDAMSARQRRKHVERANERAREDEYDDDDDDDDDDEAGVTGEDGEGDAPKRAANAFAALARDDDGERERTPSASDDDVESERNERIGETLTKKTTRRGGRGRRRRGGRGEEELDVDALVREIAGVGRGEGWIGEHKKEFATGGGVASGEISASLPTNVISALLAVDLRKMRAEDELKRLFGARVVANAEAEGTGRASALRSKFRARTTFSAYRDAWSTYRNEGVYMTIKRAPELAAGITEYEFAWKREYEDAHFHFTIAVESHDPYRLLQHASDYPWHLETQLRIAELYMFTGKAQESSEILERCLYACERSWHPTFASTAASGCARLDSSVPANKPMFEALWRHVIALTRRGCHKTALDTAKFLLGLDHADPKGVLCCIDYFALRCGQERWLIDFAQTFGPFLYVGDGEWGSNGSLLSFPGFAYSYAMAFFAIGDVVQADAYLLQAMITHPYAFSATMSMLKVDNPELKSVLAHRYFSEPSDCRSVEHLSEIFATRHHALWKTEAMMRWSTKIAKMAVELIESGAESPALGGCNAHDFMSVTQVCWSPSPENLYWRLVIEDFQDVVKRGLPEDDPLAQPAPRRGHEGQ